MTWQDQREMTPRQFEHAMELLGLKQAEVARFLGMSDRQCRRLVRGQRHIGGADRVAAQRHGGPRRQAQGAALGAWVVLTKRQIR